MPDRELLRERGAAWVYSIRPSPTQTQVGSRAPSKVEEPVVAYARDLLEGRSIKALVLLDGPTVVYQGYKPPATATSVYYSASVAKTFTAMAVGQAICSGKLRLDEQAADRIPALAAKPLGRAKVRDLLRMASGAAPPLTGGNPFTGNIWTDTEAMQWSRGDLDLIDSVASDRIASAERGMFTDFQPGEHFVYKNTDPLVLGLMIEAATGMPYAEWFQQRILDPAGAVGPGWIGQNKRQQARADAGLHFRLEDWVRLAWWVKRSSQQPGCFGDYVRDAARTQISREQFERGRSVTTVKGYGYLIYTDNAVAPGTYWAIGYGGQLIGWSEVSNRMLIAFSNSADWTLDAFKLMRRWAALR